MDEEWPELEEAKRKRDEQIEEELRELNAELFAEELDKRLPHIVELRRIKELLPKCLNSIKELISTWDPIITPLFYKLSEAVWGERQLEQRTFWNIETKVVLSATGDALSLLWEANCLKMWYSGWLTVEMELDEECQLLGFLMECKGPDYYLTSGMEIDDLKGKLLQVFEKGAVRDNDRKRKPGVPFDEILNNENELKGAK